MRTRILPMPLVAVVGLGFALGVAAQSPPVFIAPSPVTEKAEKAAAAQTSPVHLLPGAAEVLQLARAKIGDDTVVAFIKSSKTGYNLNANEVVYLREQGVSDRVLSAMLDQRPPVSQTWAQQANSAPSAPADAQSSTTTTYAQPAPTYAYQAPAYGYYDSYPYRCGGFWRSLLPAISFSFGFGHGHHGGNYRGGYGVGFHVGSY